MLKIFCLYFCFIFVVFLSGCGQPALKLDGQSVIKKKYTNLGTVTVQNFFDNRPDWEKSSGSVSRSKVGLLYSAKTNPDIGTYLKNVIIKQSKQTGIFNPVNNNGDYFINGSITSAVIGERQNEASYFSPLVGLFVKDTVSVEFNFYASVRHNNQPLIDKVYSFHETLKISQVKITRSALSKILEAAVSNTVQQLFDEIYALQKSGR